MSGLTVLYIDSKENKIIKVPHPKDHQFKAVKKFANQEVLCVMMFYETENRIPTSFIKVDFMRLKLDSEGAYFKMDEDMAKAYDNSFAFETAETLAKRLGPLPIPIFPDIPTNEEKAALYAYLSTKQPTLSKVAPSFIESEIRKAKRIHEEKIKLVKDAHRLASNVN